MSLTVSREFVTDIAFAQPAQGIYVSSYLYICVRILLLYLREFVTEIISVLHPESAVVCVPRLLYLSRPFHFLQLGSSSGHVCPHKTILRLSCPACIRVLILLHISSCYTCSSSVYVCAAVFDGVAGVVGVVVVAAGFAGVAPPLRPPS